jgi:hypothetical protein
MGHTTVVQEFVFDLATNSCLPSQPTGYGFYGRPVQFDMGVSPQMLFDVIHPDDVDLLMAHIERASELRPGEVVTGTVRFLHVCGEYVETYMEARLEESMHDERARLVRSTSTWVVPEGVEPTFIAAEPQQAPR